MFTDLYNDKDFTKNIESLLKPFYKVNKIRFQDHAVDWEDFLQEMWCELFEDEHSHVIKGFEVARMGIRESQKIATFLDAVLASKDVLLREYFNVSTVGWSS